MTFFDPNPRKPRKKWANIPQTPIIPSIPADSSNYRLSSFTPTTLIPPGSNLNTADSHDSPSLLPGPDQPLPLASPFSFHDIPYVQDPGSSRLRAEGESSLQKVDEVLQLISKKFPSLGDFLEILFLDNPRDSIDPRSSKHIQMLAAFLGGRTTFRAVNLVEKIYRHRYSIPHKRSNHKKEMDLFFDPQADPCDVHYARPALSIWALQLVGPRCRAEIGTLAYDDPEEPGFRVHLAASTNARMKGKRQTVSWDNIWGFSMQGNVSRISRRAKASWYVVECMTATKKNGLAVVRKHRPHPFVQAAAISSFVMCRNKYANGYMALVMGVWNFACKSHIDLKRVYCRLGLIVSDTTVRKALNSLTEDGRNTLQHSVAENIVAKGDVGYCLVIDNVQQYIQVHEPGIGKVNQLQVGTAATAIRLEDYEPGAFDFDDYMARVTKHERSSLTVEALYHDIDWKHINYTTSLHFVRILCEFVPQLNHLCPKISDIFRSAPVSKHRMRPGRKTLVQPLGTNSEREIETKGMKQCLLDFDGQMGIKGGETSRMLLWARGDGGSFAAAQRLKKYLGLTDLDVYKNFQNRLFTVELWHAKSTNLNTTAANFYGPRTTDDPSALSRCAAATNMYRPSNLQSCNFYPTARSMQLFWEANILDIWSVYLAHHKDILVHFQELDSNQSLPSLESLILDAKTLVRRYASTAAAEQALRRQDMESAPNIYRVPVGRQWISHSTNESDEKVDKGDQKESPPFKEDDGFDGDRVLANSVLFLRDFSWWIEAVYAVADGDIGRAFEILKIWIFSFAGGSNQNYVSYLLETYCLFKYEASKTLKDAIWNNWLVNLTGELGSWIEADLLQEHYNRWLEDMVQKHGGRFDDSFYRQTISPNVHCFLRIKEEFESAFELSRRSKSHTSPHLRDEYKILLTIFREEQLHLFRPTRSMGHAASDLLNRGYKRLHEEKLPEFLKKSTEQALLLARWNRETRSEGVEIASANPRLPDNPSECNPESDLADNSHGFDSAGSESGSEDAGEAPSNGDKEDEVDTLLSQVIEEENIQDDDIPRSGSDLTFVIDNETGRLVNDWYDEDQFAALVCESEVDLGQDEADNADLNDEPEVDGDDERPSSDDENDN
ncbi:hypothetical protein ARMSODRAFT_892428 [Armillaria solidipes]|uniref:DUF6589 domain-containing protein n=1 Tax=Armillaria solidipes TaxID=1076256 RepID=A0A2H3BLW1_9AGAR|nr:hypothetical protein ARMSODRAFT_892428 [Armillaria solidipes]